MPFDSHNGGSNIPKVVSLPLSADFGSDEDYIESLLSFVTSDELFQTLCGGVHILDFFTKDPDFYSTVVPVEWRVWFRLRDISDILDLLMRETITGIESMLSLSNRAPASRQEDDLTWRQGCFPPASFLLYILTVRKHAMSRSFNKHTNVENDKSIGIPRHISVGMKPKKKHEVENFVSYINDLISNINMSNSHDITHIVDFGSGQNYLGRALASPPCNRHVIALESKQHNISGAKTMDVTARLAEKSMVRRNKKEYREGLPNAHQEAMTLVPSTDMKIGEQCRRSPEAQLTDNPSGPRGENGSVQYIETRIDDGELSSVIHHVNADSSAHTNRCADIIVVSLHSCGNLLHHGLRSLVLNPAVKVVAMVGCCYNLITERLGPPTHKLPSLRSFNLRLDQTSSAYDPHGFPMSERLASYRHKSGYGIRLNITARMMAVQAPGNWTDMDCDSFFTRHFYRALLQRIFLERGVVEAPVNDKTSGTSPRGCTGPGPALTIGSLRKSCYTSFTAYVRGAIAKLKEDPQRGAEISKIMDGLDDREIESYEEKYRAKKKELSVVWTLMAFSATVIESTIVTDRWLYLKEQSNIKRCWVETVFDYKQSPRNLVVVGIKH